MEATTEISFLFCDTDMATRSYYSMFYQYNTCMFLSFTFAMHAKYNVHTVHMFLLASYDVNITVCFCQL